MSNPNPTSTSNSTSTPKPTLNRELLIELRDKIKSLPSIDELHERFREEDAPDDLDRDTLAIAAERGINQIWMQWVWVDLYSECGTAACAAGWTALLTGKEISDRCEVQHDFKTMAVRDYAREVLGLTWGQAENLFCGNNTRDDMDRIFAELLEEQ